MALPWLWAVRPRTAIRLTLGHSSSRALWSLNFRPTTFGSRPVPLMSLPIRSISSTSTWRKRQPRHPPLGQREQFAFAGLELLGRHGLDPRRLVVGVFDDGQPGQDVALREHFGGHAADDLVEAEVLDRAVIDLRPFAVAQPDQQHLHQAAFDRAGEAGVRLDAVADQHVIGLEGQAVEVDRKTLDLWCRRLACLGSGTAAPHWPTTTVSMLERIGQPTNSSVMP